MAQYLIRRLERFAKLSAEDKKVLEAAAGQNLRRLAAREDIIHEGDEPRHVNVVLGGWAIRYKALEDGRRQILAFILPGEMCDLNMFILRRMDHSISAVTPMRLAELSPESVEAITAGRPRLAQALRWATLVNEATQREWTLNIGQRTALERIAHLLCELFARLRAVGLTNGTGCELPVTQAELADSTGLSTVHVNRTLQELRSAGLIDLRGKHLSIPDLAALERAALFNDGYLHLHHEGERLDAKEG